MKIFQYWDEPDPPADVMTCINSVRTGNPSLEHVLFNEATARAWIARHRSNRELAAFMACAVPAMQADYFRLCLIETLGGLYLDADFFQLESLSSMMAEASGALLMDWNGVLLNGLMIFERPFHPFVSACLALATENILHRRFNDVVFSAGPAVLSAVRYAVDTQVRSKLDYIVSVSTWDGGDWASLVETANRLYCNDERLYLAYRQIQSPPTEWQWRWLSERSALYKASGRHWLNWKGSIYRNA